MLRRISRLMTTTYEQRGDTHPEGEPEGLPRRADQRGTHALGVAGSVQQAPQAVPERGASGASVFFLIKMGWPLYVETA